MKFHDEPIHTCFWCGRSCECARHHLIGGAYRSKADKLGLYVPLCPKCHERVHTNGKMMRQMRRYAELHMLKSGWTREQWRREFGKDYLEE